MEVINVLKEWMHQFSLYTCTSIQILKNHTQLWINKFLQNFIISIFFQEHPTEEMEIDPPEETDVEYSQLEDMDTS